MNCGGQLQVSTMGRGVRKGVIGMNIASPRYKVHKSRSRILDDLVTCENII